MSLNIAKKRFFCSGVPRRADGRTAEARPGQAEQERRVAPRELLGADDAC